MANRIIEPFAQIIDDTGLPRQGCRLFFYASGTSTKLNTYSDAALSVANPNPIVLNEFGQPTVSVFGKNQPYKIVLAGPDELGVDDPPTNVIRTIDPVMSSDFALFFKAFTGSVNPNGQVAGTAGSDGVLPDTYWDYVAKILYFCTTTGDATDAVWTAINAAAATPAVPPPQGRLSLTNGVPVLGTGLTGANVYYSVFVGNLVPIYNGTTFVPTEVSNLQLALHSSHTVNTVFDVFVAPVSGVLTLVTGPAWANSSPGTGSRGTGAASTEITRIKGIWVNAVDMTARNGTTTYSIGANRATYLGSIMIDAVAGQVTCHTTWGQARKWGVWNAYNRQPIELRAGDASVSWSSAPTTFRQSNGVANNYALAFAGLPEEMFEIDFSQSVRQAVNNSDCTADIAIGVNSTTVASGRFGRGFLNMQFSAAGPMTVQQMLNAKHVLNPFLGYNTINMLEQAGTGSTSNQFFGTDALMMLTVKGRA